MRNTLNRLATGLAIITFTVVVLLCAVTYFTPGVWVSKSDVIEALEKQGYQKAVINDKDVMFVSFGGCGKDDDASFEATALNPRNQRVDVLVCTGWPLKGATVRTK